MLWVPWALLTSTSSLPVPRASLTSTSSLPVPRALLTSTSSLPVRLSLQARGAGRAKAGPADGFSPKLAWEEPSSRSVQAESRAVANAERLASEELSSRNVQAEWQAAAVGAARPTRGSSECLSCWPSVWWEAWLACCGRCSCSSLCGFGIQSLTRKQVGHENACMWAPAFHGSGPAKSVSMLLSCILCCQGANKTTSLQVNLGPLWSKLCSLLALHCLELRDYTLCPLSAPIRSLYNEFVARGVTALSEYSLPMGGRLSKCLLMNYGIGEDLLD